MSVRGQIGFYSNNEMCLENYNILLYIHRNSTPEYVIPIIGSVLENKSKYRNYINYEYLSAWILYEFMSKRVKLNLEKDKYIVGIENDGIPAKDFLGFGISDRIHVDIEYFYCIFPNRIDIFKTGCYTNVDKWNKIDSVFLKESKELIT